MEIMKSVLIKEVDGGRLGDKVAFVENLPKAFLYRKALKLVIDRTNPQQNLVPAYKMVEGNRIETGETVDELLPGIEMSQTNDGAYVFFTYYNEAKARLADIDQYIKTNVPVAERVPQRVPYAIQPGVLTSGPRPLSDLPHVVLPAPVSPPAQAVQEGIAPMAVLEAPKKERKPLSEAQKQAARERMAKARECRAAKAVISK